jgi:hypothetical protein
MQWRSRDNSASTAVHMLLALGLALLPAGAFAQQHEAAENVFARFSGDWSGTGTVKTSNGNERLRCKAHYDVSGTSLQQTLHCASDSYKLEVTTKVVANGSTFSGKWAEITRDTIGNISGTVTNAGIHGKIDGIGFTADLSISAQANRQSVTIDPTGATDISHVAITLTKS